jgi:transposase-like protein
MDNCSPFKWRHFEAEIILRCVRWYLRYSLSYRDLEGMMEEKAVQGINKGDSTSQIAFISSLFGVAA